MSLISTTAPRLRLPDQVNIDFGPVELLGPAFLQLDRLARERGVYLSISNDFDELARVNRRNQGDDWYKLMPTFDPEVGGINERNGFWIHGVNDAGEIVVVQAARLYLWPDSTFAEEWAKRSFLYPDPELQSAPAEQCEIDCPAADHITGRVGFTGTLWLRSDYRSVGLASIMPRVTRAYAVTRWYPDVMFSLAEAKPWLTRPSVRRLYGWRNLDHSAKWLNSSSFGDIDIALCWMGRDDVLDDVAEFTQAAVEMPVPQPMAA